MKRYLSVFLVALLLFGGMSVGASAAAAPKASLPYPLSLIDPINMTEEQIIFYANLGKSLGIDSALIKAVVANAPYAVKAALDKAGIVDYPIYERSAFWNFIFKWIFFGWIWMK